MNAHELFKNGDLAQAIDAQIKTVKAQPADQGQRLFLFELLAFAGEWVRAQKQIDVLHYDDPKIEAAVQGYRRLLDAEGRRRQLFSQLTPPEHFAPPPEHMALRLSALQELKSGRPAQAAELIQRADEKATAVEGTCNGTAFQGLRDADDRLGPILEVMAHGIYYWVPVEQIASITLTAPRSPRDLLWAAAHLELRAGAAGDVFLPALYAGSESSADAEVKLGRKTEWSEGAGPVCGAGAKTFLVGEGGMALLDWREVVFKK